MKIVKEYILFEKFQEDSDPISDLGIGVAHMFPDICKSILENDDLKLFFTVIYNKTSLYSSSKSKSYFFQIWVNVPRINDFPDYCNNVSLKEYVENILYKKLNYENIFIDIHLSRKFKYNFPDIDTPEKYISHTPSIYCEINPNIKENIKQYHIKIQREFNNKNKLKVEIE